MSTPNIFRTNLCINRVIDWREFMGRRFLVCQTITNGGYTYIAAVAEDNPDITPATPEEWAEALAKATKAKAKADKQEEFRAKAERYGLKVQSANRYGRNDVTIVRVTRTRYIDATGGQWIRLRREGYGRDGLCVGDKSYFASHLTIDSLKAIESACGGADTYDFIKAGEAKESAK